MNFYYPQVILLIVPLIFIIYYYIKPTGYRTVLRVALKTLVIFMVLLSIASPYTVVERRGLTGSAGISIIADRTDSMRLFDPGTPDEIHDYLINRTPTEIDFITGTKSSIGDSIVKNTRAGGNILLVTDGNNNYGRSVPDAIDFARSLNATVYLLRQEPIKKDMRVSITGDAGAILGSPADFYIEVDAVGRIESELVVRADNNIIYTAHVAGSKRIPVTYSFGTQGSHTIKAELASEDEIPQNNVFYRSVHVVPRPHVLLVSKKDSPLSRILARSYSVDRSSNLMFESPYKASYKASYKAIILDDMSASELSGADALSDYVAGGGGLITVGGPNAYEDYDNLPLLDQLIPVKTGGVPPPGEKTGIVLVMDISGSTGELYGADPKLGIEKGLVLQILNNIDTDNFLGVIAFNNAPHTIVPFGRYQDMAGIRDVVARLKYGGTTRLAPALAAAGDLLRNFDGGRNVIVISDGIAADGDAALSTARNMADEGIAVYAIGVGGDTDEEFMKKLAKTGGYLRRDQSRGIELLFGETVNNRRGDGFPVMIINSGHFITGGASLNATVSSYNNVHAKKNAQALLATPDGNPVLSVWRFGLGRVVSITVDNGNRWAKELYSQENARVILTSTNYAIGSLSQDIRARDGELGSPIDVYVYSEREPYLSFDGERIEFERERERVYHAAIISNTTGFHDISGYTIAVNQPSEYRELGNNELIADIAGAAGGHVYNRSEIDRLIPDINTEKSATFREMVDLGPMFLFAALLLYSIEVILRRMYEIFR